jgi:hypothetical protein
MPPDKPVFRREILRFPVIWRVFYRLSTAAHHPNGNPPSGIYSNSLGATPDLPDQLDFVPLMDW